MKFSAFVSQCFPCWVAVNRQKHGQSLKPSSFELSDPCRTFAPITPTGRILGRGGSKVSLTVHTDTPLLFYDRLCRLSPQLTHIQFLPALPAPDSHTLSHTHTKPANRAKAWKQSAVKSCAFYINCFIIWLEIKKNPLQNSLPCEYLELTSASLIFVLSYWTQDGDTDASDQICAACVPGDGNVSACTGTRQSSTPCGGRLGTVRAMWMTAHPCKSYHIISQWGHLEALLRGAREKQQWGEWQPAVFHLSFMLRVGQYRCAEAQTAAEWFCFIYT